MARTSKAATEKGDGRTDAPREAETAEQTAHAPTETERDLFAGLPNPCVYCGPSVPGVARQYTTYQGGGISEALREFVKKYPQVRGLIVSAGQFAAVRKRLDTPETAEARLYKQVKELL